MRGGASYDIPSNCVREENRVFGYYRPNMLTAPLSPQAASESHSLLPGRELMEHDEGSDSSLVTSSECTSPSPGSSQSEHSSAYYSSSSTESHASSTLNSHSTTNPTKEAQTHQSILNQMTYIGEHNSLTPLNSEPTISLMDSTPKSESDQVITLTPCTSSGGNSHDDGNKYGRDVDECDKQKLSATKITSSGKIKTVKCKQCDFVTTTKLDLWEHNIIHIEANKLLKCSECTFVTKYKHHLQFHLRNHSGSKPFRCTHCSYMCNNKSMLKSHLKSHSNLYPYRCAECNYASKYSHSLKLHLQKYNHRNHVILNSDGTPNLSSSIDVHGTRRGPKSTSKRSEVQNSPVPPQLDQFSIEQMRMQLQSQLLYCLYNPISNLSLHQNLQELITERHVQNSPHSPERERYSSGDYEEIASESGPLDLSKPEDASQKTQRNGTTRNDSVFLNSSDEEADYMTTMFENVEIVHTQEEPSSETDDHEETSASSNKPEEYYCQHCQITFGEPTMYTIHMGYHGHEEPFTCNMCGEVSDDKVSFSIHIARAPHPM